MTTPEEKLAELGLALPKPVALPPGLHLPFTFIKIRGDRALISGHPAQAADGSLAGPYGKVGTDFDTAAAYDIARDIGLSVLANLKAEIGSLDRVAGWARVFGMVNAAPGYTEAHLAVNGFSDLILEIFGPDAGRHARSAIGVAELPMNFAMEIEAEVFLSD